MKVLGICGSPRSEKTSNSLKLLHTALDATGLETEIITVRGKKINGCTGCLGCVESNVCVVKDDLFDMRDKFLEADAYIVAAPNYFTGLNALTSALLERWYQFRHREGDSLWGKLAVAIGVGGGDGECVADRIEQYMSYSFIETVAKVTGQGPACCFECGYGETCKVGAIAMFFPPGTKITEDITPDVTKQPDVMLGAVDAG
jgi:multimeric flavodoxin WrbA